MKMKTSVREYILRALSMLVVCLYLISGSAFGEATTMTDTGSTDESQTVLTEDTSAGENTNQEKEAAPSSTSEGNTETDSVGTEGTEQTEPENQVPDDHIIPTEGPAQTDEPSQPTEEPVQPTEEPVTPTEEPTDPPAPVDMKTLFKVDIKVPSDWTNAKAKNVRVKVTPLSDAMWDKAQYKLGGGDWIVIRDKFTLLDGYYYVDIEVTDNAVMTVRLSNVDGVFMDEKKEIKIFDRSAPVVTAGFNDKLLHVEAPDDLSGAAGVQVNGLLFTTLENGKLDVRMEDVLLTYKQLAIRAYDYAGNFSDPVTLDNPYYVAATPTPKPTSQPTAKPTATTVPTSKPTRKPSGGGTKPTAEPTAEATEVPSAIPVATDQPVAITTQEPMIIYVTQEPVVTPEPIKETVYVPLGPGQPYTSSGNMQTLDVLYSAATNKQFITVQSRGGQTYYLVIDYDKPIDEENEIYETYFLNLVDDRDLMAVLSDEEKEEVPTPTPEIIYVTPEPTAVPEPTTEPEVKKDNSSSMMLLLVILLAGGGFALWFFKFRNSGGKNQPAPVMEYDEDDFYDDDSDDSAEDSE